jgi:hypothetical protein
MSKIGDNAVVAEAPSAPAEMDEINELESTDNSQTARAVGSADADATTSQPPAGLFDAASLSSGALAIIFHFLSDFGSDTGDAKLLVAVSDEARKRGILLDGLIRSGITAVKWNLPEAVRIPLTDHFSAPESLEDWFFTEFLHTDNPWQALWMEWAEEWKREEARILFEVPSLHGRLTAHSGCPTTEGGMYEKGKE